MQSRCFFILLSKFWVAKSYTFIMGWKLHCPHVAADVSSYVLMYGSVTRTLFRLSLHYVIPSSIEVTSLCLHCLVSEAAAFVAMTIYRIATFAILTRSLPRWLHLIIVYFGYFCACFLTICCLCCMPHGDSRIVAYASFVASSLCRVAMHSHQVPWVASWVLGSSYPQFRSALHLQRDFFWPRCCSLPFSFWTPILADHWQVTAHSAMMFRIEFLSRAIGCSGSRRLRGFDEGFRTRFADEDCTPESWTVFRIFICER